MFKLLQVILLIFFLAIFALAGTTGKLSGIVQDKATGDPLPGVNVLIEGTLLGASTDVDGFYTILHIPAKTYTVKFIYVGYQDIKVENIRIVPDITKRLNAELTEATLELDEQIIVVAERPFFEVSATNTVRVLDSEQIENMPIKGVNQAVAVNAGVVSADGSGGETDNAALNVRGGRANETLVIVDGIPINNILGGGGNGAQGTLPDVAIEQVSSQLGGFSAKYGNAQAGIVNIVTKSGEKKYFGGIEGLNSSLFDDFDYTSVSAYLGGPLFPGSKTYGFFGSVELLDTKDDDPSAINLKIPSAGINSSLLPDNESQVLRYTGKIDGHWGNLSAILSSNGSFRESRIPVANYYKNNSAHNPRVDEVDLGASLKLSYTFDNTAFGDAIIRYRRNNYERGDGVWGDNFYGYGDPTINSAIDTPGEIIRQDDVGVFNAEGAVNNRYTKYQLDTYGFDLNFTKQFDNNLVEIGFNYDLNTLRYYTFSPRGLAIGQDDFTEEERYFNLQPFYYGYDLFGEELESNQERNISGQTYTEFGARNPIQLAAYFQDKVEFEDFILNLGFRWDYFDADGYRFRKKDDIYGFGANPNRLELADLEKIPVENYISPRIGFAFPVTEKTVFHAQYGIFKQRGDFFRTYDSWLSMNDLENGEDLLIVYNGHTEAENTTQYEFGFKQQIADFASLDLTAYYKNIRGLLNIVQQQTSFGLDTLNYLTAANTDFGTVKGLAASFNLRRIGPISAKLDYTLAVSEGTGSSQTSSYTAAFRNANGEVPKQIAPLDFDQRHTLTANIDVRAGDKEGPMLFGQHLFQNTGANFLITYNSGRPYTPLEYVDVTIDQTQQGDVSQFINSTYSEGTFRVDLKIDKLITVGKMQIVPYLWVQNLFNRENFTFVYQSTGKPDDSAFLSTSEGIQRVRASGEPYIEDYKALEKDPQNYGVPRIVRLGLKIRF
ncbi:MAG: TonB-dependent receptor [Calditrichaeota bacterium]|nr:MAG: TonB-dependent receptor [Calditrichota bacterium]MBL1207552.1 TonB-dependent receptor [Calditrichota bacterium]NOG47384.1 TonB-dependent receptor [Calditrichota bacterium]